MKKKFSVITKNKNNIYNKIITVDPDKSITHRCYILASQCVGISIIKGLNSHDVASTINGLKKLGIKIIKKNNKNYVYGTGISGFKKFTGTINFQNSGTSARGFLGILACYPYPVTITGDSSLKVRPFKRLTNFLENIGASFIHPKNKSYSLPLKIHGTKKWALSQKHYIKIPSAQIATALIYSALQSKGITEIIETAETRDHTQRLLKSLKADIKVKKTNGRRITKIRGQNEMPSFSIQVPADPSSACFFVVQTLLSKKSSLLIKNVCINKTRIGFLEILKKMGGKIKILNKKKYFEEDVADLFVQSSNLKGIICPTNIIVKAIDDLPILWVACALSEGVSFFKGISELQFKESNRIKTISDSLKKFGIKVIVKNDSIKIYGNREIKPNKQIKISSNLDHRVAMSNFVFGTVLGVEVLIKGFETVLSSFPNFLKIQKQIGIKYEIKKN